MVLYVNKSSYDVLIIQHKQGSEMACSRTGPALQGTQVTFAVQRRDMKLVAAGKLGRADWRVLDSEALKPTLRVAICGGDLGHSYYIRVVQF